VSQDSIEREITVAAPVERVWRTLTDPEQMKVWFSASKPPELDLRPGGVMTLHYPHGSFPSLIVDVDPPRRFAYRNASAWPGELADESNSTLVEFTLEPQGEGTLLRVVESGFDSVKVPEGGAGAASYESHANGWPWLLQGLAKLAERH